MMDNPSDRIVLANWTRMRQKRERFLPIQEEDVAGVDFENFNTPVIDLAREIRKGEIPMPGKMKVVNSVPVFTRTAKMAAYSFSLPAGLPGIHGSCPASNLPASEALARTEWAGVFGGGVSLRRKPAGIKSMTPEDIRGVYICDACYAGKSSYAMYDNVHIVQRIRLLWVKKTLREGTFVDEMSSALSSALWTQKKVGKKHLINPAFFRIHDSGDFFSPEYMAGWFEVCENIHSEMPNVRFWAPTRVWGDPDYEDVMEDIPGNLALRPSSLFYGIPAPRVPDLAAGTTSSPSKVARHWDCPAYQSGVLESCEGVGCRTCWTRPGVPVNYPTH